MFTVVLPLLVYVSKNTAFKLNLNDYRNAHYQKLNNAKIAFVDVTKRDVLGLPKMNAAEIHYKLFLKGDTGKKGDVANFCSIADKFFCDALVEANRLPEDNYEHVPEVRYKFGGLDVNNPRIEATIHPIGDLLPNSEEDQMQIILTENEIKQAIEEFVFKSMNVNEDKAIDIDIKATRGADGTTAVIDIVDREGDTPEPVKDVKTSAKKKPGPKPKAVDKPQASTTSCDEQEAPDPEPAETEAQPVFEEESEETTATEEPESEAEEDDGSVVDPVEETETEEAPTEPAPKKSLFAGLGKPKNN